MRLGGHGSDRARLVPVPRAGPSWGTVEDQTVGRRAPPATPSSRPSSQKWVWLHKEAACRTLTASRRHSKHVANMDSRKAQAHPRRHDPTTLTCLGCCNKTPWIRWLINKRRLLLTELEAEEPMTKAGPCLVRLRSWFSPSLTAHAAGTRGLSGVLHTRPTHRALLS